MKVLFFSPHAGAFLFFRRFGLAPLAALTGALLFGMNGVFAWQRGAAFNPIAFLPWLFLCVESLFIHAANAGLTGLARLLLRRGSSWHRDPFYRGIWHRPADL